MSWLHYLIEANIYLGVFYLCYCLLLNRDTHYNLGRFYLVFTSVLAFILPLTQASVLKPVLPEIEIVPVTGHIILPKSAAPGTPAIMLTLNDYLLYLYIAGAVVALGVLVYRLHKLYMLTHQNTATDTQQYKLVNLQDENTAFSFFNYLFIGNNVPQAETIIAHELVHIRQKHSADIIFLEILKIVNWFNPLVYLVQRSLKTIHEYIADEQTAAQEHDALSYSAFLLNNAYGIQGTSVTHSFFNYNLLKKRIIMLNKNRSGKLARLKYLAALPLCAGMLCTSTLLFSKDYGLIDLAPRKAPMISQPLIDSTKYALKITGEDGLSIISDKIVLTNPKSGTNKTYTVNSLTDQDIKDLKAKGQTIEIVKRETVKKDTVPPPPPPAPPVKAKRAPKSPPKPIVIEEPKRSDVTIDPPAVAEVKDPGKVIEIAEPVPAPPSAQINRRPPPPVPYAPAYTDFFRYVVKHTRYPTVAYNNKVNGHVTLTVVIGNNHKISDAKVVSGIGSGCDEEAARAIKTYAEPLDKAPGTYKMVVTFLLRNEAGTKFYAPKPLTDVGSSNFIGQVEVIGSIND